MSRFSGGQIGMIETGIKNRILGQQSLFENVQASVFAEQLYYLIIK